MGSCAGLPSKVASVPAFCKTRCLIRVMTEFISTSGPDRTPVLLRFQTTGSLGIPFLNFQESISMTLPGCSTSYLMRQGVHLGRSVSFSTFLPYQRWEQRSPVGLLLDFSLSPTCLGTPSALFERPKSILCTTKSRRMTSLLCPTRRSIIPSIQTVGPGSGTLYPVVSAMFCLLTSSSSEYLREPVAEFFGVMILIIFGNGVDCQVVLSGNTGVASSAKGVSLFEAYYPTGRALNSIC